VAPADACAAGCDDGFVCKPDKDAGCNRTSISTDPSCWSCLQAPPKKPNSPPGRPVAPADACAAGCDDGFVCKPDKDAGCNRTSISTDPSCWSCLQAPPKKPNSPPGRPVAPADACAAGCDDGFVCKPDKDAGCKRTSISTDASCWSCLQAPTPKPTRRRRRRQRKTRDPN